MRPAAGLAAALGAHEPDPVADLLPVDRVEVAQLRLDRHGPAPAQASRAAVRARGRWRYRVEAATPRRLATSTTVISGSCSRALAAARALGPRAGASTPGRPRAPAPG